MATGFLRGAAAGAAGTTALNAVTYLDMVIRGRRASDTPREVVEAGAERAGITIPGEGEQRDNRVAGLGPLAGTGVGVAVGALSGLVHEPAVRWGRILPAPVAILLMSAGSMALSDLPLKWPGISDPSTWTAADWASDVVPHLAYGTVAYATLRATDPS